MFFKKKKILTKEEKKWYQNGTIEFVHLVVDMHESIMIAR